MTNEPDEFEHAGMTWVKLGNTRDPVIEAYREAIWNIGSAVAEFWYEHADVRLPPTIQIALERLDRCEFNPLRPVPPEGMPPEGGI